MNVDPALPTASRRPTEAGRGLQSGALSLCVAVLVLAPLYLGGNRPLPLMGLELAALVMFGLAFRSGTWMMHTSLPLRVVLAGVAILPFVQLVPLPFELWLTLPGRAEYGAALAEVAATPAWRAASIVPYRTDYVAWAVLPPLAMFVCVIGLPGLQVRRVVWVFVAMVVFQALLGLLQYGDGAASWLRPWGSPGDASAIGTYPNRNLLAGMLIMGLPILLALLAASLFGLERSQPRHRRRGRWLARVKGWGGNESGSNRTALYLAMVAAVLLGVVFTRSRSGIALAMLGLILAALLLGRNFGGSFSTRMISAVSALGLTLATAVGLAPVLARFGQDPLGDPRWPILEASLQAGATFFPLGSGAGTYQEVIAALHPDSIVGESFINHAHNDYVEWWVEGGLPAIVLMGLAGVLYLLRWRAVWRVRNWQTLHMMQVGAGIGMLLVMLHGLTDFNLRIPANAIYFALLAAVFLHPGETCSDRGAERSRRAAMEWEQTREDAWVEAPERPVQVARGAEAGSARVVSDAPRGGRNANPFADPPDVSRPQERQAHVSARDSEPPAAGP